METFDLDDGPIEWVLEGTPERDLLSQMAHDIFLQRTADGDFFFIISRQGNGLDAAVAIPIHRYEESCEVKFLVHRGSPFYAFITENSFHT